MRVGARFFGGVVSALCVALSAMVGIAEARDRTTVTNPFVKAAPNVLPVEEEQRVEAATLGTAVHPARATLDRNPIYDKSNPDFKRLQLMDDALRLLKRDSIGFPDWMSALRNGQITPRAGLLPNETMSVLDLDVVMKNTREMPNVIFPHVSHTMWLDCSNCHPVPFLPRAGVNQITMADIFRGKYCGMCHDRVAFVTFFACQRCHSGQPNMTNSQRERTGISPQ